MPLETCVQPKSITYGVVQPGAVVEDGVPIIRVNNFLDTRLELSKLIKISPEVEAKYERTRLAGGEVLLTLVGTVGQVAVVPREAEGFNVARAVGVIHPLPHVSAEWIAICLRSPLSQHLLGSRANTTVQTTINLKDVRALPIPMPSLEERNRISSLIMALDSRITLLRETNTTLEAIAQALFKSWFVNFDPVRAKQQGLAPEGMNEATTALFPDRFEESELGAVPRGWRVGALGDELKIAYGKNLPTSKLLPTGYPVYGGNGRIGFIDKYLYETRQVLIACRGAASGKVNQSCPKAFVTNNSLVLESGESPLPFGYIKGYMYGSDLTPFVTGSAQPQVTIDNLKAFKMLIPDTDILKIFESFSSTIEDKIEENAKQAQTLASLRDTLLPRLISGRLRLPEGGTLDREALSTC